MKKLYKSILATALLAVSAGASAQNMYDAINLSRNVYFGTARSMALGNAVTALGGDLGTVGINPAGSAVASYGQLTITPGIMVSSVASEYSSGDDWNGTWSTMRKAIMPNWGLSASFSTGRSKGLKSFVVAVTSNYTNQYLNYFNIYGTNSQTSKMAEFAAAAEGYNEGVLGNYNSFENSNVPWDILTAYQGGMFGSYGEDGKYVAISEALRGDGVHYVPGKLAQNSAVQKNGSKRDLVFNFGANFSDTWYFGFNLGLPNARYDCTESFYESAVNPDQFLLTFTKNDGYNYDTYFTSSNYTYKYVSDVEGVYGKFGVIARPFDFLRFGLTFQTPTLYTITESWQYAASTSFTDSYFNLSATSPAGKYSYNLVSPYSVGMGMALTIGDLGFVSIDYEMMDYSVMRFSDINRDYMAVDNFRDLNETNRYFAGVSNNLRMGLEVRLLPGVSVRAGYEYLSSPEKYWVNNLSETVYSDDFLADYELYNSRVLQLVGSKYVDDGMHSASFGFGYSSPGSFFLDLAVKFTKYQDSIYYPYFDYPNCNSDGVRVDVPSPEIRNSRNQTSAVATFGWRF